MPALGYFAALYRSGITWYNILKTEKSESKLERNCMKKIMFGNSLMLLSIAFFVLVGLKNMPVYIFWPAMILLIVGFIMAVVGFFSNSN